VDSGAETATVDVSDFLYTCSSHLSDPDFARLIDDDSSNSSRSNSPSQRTVTQEDIERVKKEYHDKKSKAKKGDKDKDESDKSTVAAAASPKGSSSPPGAIPPSPAATAPTPPTPRKHKKYTLHRDVLRMRQDIKIKAFYSQSAKQASTNLPSAPRGLPGTLPPPPS
jgi:hypothetical protein